MADVADALEDALETKMNNMLNVTGGKHSDDFDGDDDGLFADFDNSFMRGDKVHFHPCQKILWASVSQGSAVKTWDVLLMLPNLAFAIFLCCRVATTLRKLRATNSAVFRAYHGLVLISAAAAVLRGCVAMSISSYNKSHSGQVAEQLLWLGLSFVLLTMELSVLMLGMRQQDSQSSVKRVVLLATLISLIHTSVQSLLELQSPNALFNIKREQVFGHGGPSFLLLTSLLLGLTYALVLGLQFKLGPYRAFMGPYCGLMFVLNMVQALGAFILLAQQNPTGICLVNMTNYIYLAIYTPIVYFSFISPFFKAAQPTLLFSYKAQVDDMEELPQSGSMQFSLTDQNHHLDEEENNGPIVVNGRNGNQSIMPSALASPDSVLNGNFVQ